MYAGSTFSADIQQAAYGGATIIVPTDVCQTGNDDALRMGSGDTYQSRNGYSDKVVAIDVGNSCYLHASHASPHHI